MPKSIEKDFYIWLFIKDPNTSKIEAKKIIKESFRINGALKRAYIKKTGERPPRRGIILSPKKLALIKRYKKLAKELILSKKDIFNRWISLSTTARVYTLNYIPKKDLIYLNQKIPPVKYREMTQHYRFNFAIDKLIKSNATLLKSSLLQAPAKNNKLTYSNLMKIGFFSIKSNNITNAILYFDQARKKAKRRKDLDRALFWLYLTTKNSIYLQKASNSFDINFYSLMACDLLNKPYPKIIIPNPKKEKIENFNIKDPIEWAKLKKIIFSQNSSYLENLANRFYTKESVGLYSYIKSKAHKDIKQYFPLPYKEYILKFGRDRAAFIYALARQESRFIPSAISASFALGLMQMMPFLVKDISKRFKDKIKLTDIFDPYLSIKYANYHINYLKKHLKDPLLIAYAYNAGIGYTKRALLKKAHFKRGEFEPYLSFELVSKEQARDYGLQVLANYIIYQNILGKRVKLKDLIENFIKNNF